MNIVIIGPAHPWRGGIAHHTTLLASHLGKRHQVTVITFSRQYPSSFFPGTSQLEPATEEDPAESRRWVDSINPFTWLRTGWRVRSMSPSLVVFPFALPFFGPCYGIIAAIVRWGTPTKSLFLCHNVLPHESRPGDNLFTRFAFAFADYFIVQSAAVERDLLAMKPGAVYALAHHPVYETFGEGMDKAAARRLLGISDKRVILFFGYIRRYKGLSVLLKAMEQLDNLLLLVVGEFYENEEPYRSGIRESGLEQRIRIIDRYVPAEEVPLYFSAADAVIVPYLSATQSGVVQIAYNFDRPVIASDTGGLSEVVMNGITGHLVPPGDADALAKAIRKFYERDEADQMSATVAREKKAYSWDAFVDAIEQVSRQAQ